MNTLAQEMAFVLVADDAYCAAMPAERPAIALEIMQETRDRIVDSFMLIFWKEAKGQGFTAKKARASVDCCMILGSVMASGIIDPKGIQEHMVASVIVLHASLTDHGIDAEDVGPCPTDHAFRSAASMILKCEEASSAFELSPKILGFSRLFIQGGLQ